MKKMYFSNVFHLIQLAETGINLPKIIKMKINIF